MARILPELLESIPEMFQAFAEILGSTGEQAVLLICGAILVGVSMLVMGYLTAGALVAPVMPTSPRGREHR